MSEALSTTEEIFLDTRFAVLVGHYLPGQLIDVGDAAAVYECSGALVVQAFRALVNEGYLCRPDDAAGSTMAFEVRRWTADDIRDSFELRAAIERLAAEKAAGRASAQEIDGLRSLVGVSCSVHAMDDAQLEEAVAASLAFHIEILRLSKIDSLGALASTLVPNFLHRRTMACRSVEELCASDRMQLKICDAMESRRIDFVGSMMREHIMSGREVVISMVEDFASRAQHASHRAEITRQLEPRTLLTEGGPVIGRGSRDPTLEGRVAPFGVISAGDRVRRRS